MTVPPPERPGPAIAVGAPPLLAAFNVAGVLSPADVHAATTIARVVGESREEAVLAAALAVRGTRFGHVRIDLATVQDGVVVEGADPEVVRDLPWPEPEAWRTALGGPLTGGVRPPLVVAGASVYLSRYHGYEEFVAAELRDRAAVSLDPPPGLGEILARVVPPALEADEPNRQRLAAALAAVSSLTVIAGGPGTGKTATAGWFLAALFEAASRESRPRPLVALAAPTGKAAARLTEAIGYAAGREGVPAPIAAALRELQGSTLHRLLGWHPDRGRFRHGPETPLPHDVVVVDEMSMVSLPMAVRVLEAVRPDARLVLVGDPDQLVSIEAGTVLGDVVGPARDGHLRFSSGTRARLEPLVGALPQEAPHGGGLADNVVTLTDRWRFGRDTAIGRFADSVRAGDAEAALEVLRSGGPGLEWRDAGAAPLADPVVREIVEPHVLGLIARGQEGDGSGALAQLGEVAVLCAHRRGPLGVERWVREAQGIAHRVRGARYLPDWYPGRPVMVTSNDYHLDLFNGDLGVAIAAGDGALDVVFPGGEGPRTFGPAQLSDLETPYAMTIHKAQGSQFQQVVVVLPEEDSPLATRELLYTAVTRAVRRVVLVGSEAVIRSACRRPVARASGLGARLWD